jgi:tRNA (guanine-N7-)-methyltransferase
MPDTSVSPKRRAFFGRRKGHKLRPQRAGLMQRALPQLALDLKGPPTDNLAGLFPRRIGDVRLEIGFGAGEHLVHAAKENPEAGFIGCEAFLNGMASVLAAIEGAKLDNVRLYFGDAIELLDWLPAQSLSRIDLLYPDPWPKRRHWKRRFVSDASVKQFARLLKPGGVFRFATDIESYVEWTLVRLARSGNFLWTAEKADDWRLPWNSFPGTRYEAKAKREQRAPVYLTFKRI